MKFWSSDGRRCRWIQEKLSFRRTSDPTGSKSLFRQGRDSMRLDSESRLLPRNNIKHKFLICGPQASGKTTIFADFCDHYAQLDRFSVRAPKIELNKDLQNLQQRLGVSKPRTSGAWQPNRRCSVQIRTHSAGALPNPHLGTSITQANQPITLPKNSLTISEKSDFGYEGTPPRTSLNSKVEASINPSSQNKTANLQTKTVTPHVKFDQRQPSVDDGIDAEQFGYTYNSNFEPMSDIYEPTKNIQEQILRKMGAKILDVGGSEDQKRLWPFCFAGLSVILFVVSMDEFAFELDHQEATLLLFSRLINNRYLRNIPFIVIFNKQDKFNFRMREDSSAREQFAKNMGVGVEDVAEQEVYETLLENQFREFVNGQQQLYERDHNESDRWPTIRKSTCEFQTTHFNEQKQQSTTIPNNNRIDAFYFMNALYPDEELRQHVFTFITNLRQNMF